MQLSTNRRMPRPLAALVDTYEAGGPSRCPTLHREEPTKARHRCLASLEQTQIHPDWKRAADAAAADDS